MATHEDRQDTFSLLLMELIDGQASPESLDRLRDLMHGDPEACEAYLDQVTLHAHLQREYGAVAQPDALPWMASAQRRRDGLHRAAPVAPRAPLVKYLLAGVILLLGILLGFFLAWREQPERHSSVPYVATLTHAALAEWTTPAQARRPGDRIGPGELVLASGLIELELFGGESVVLEGPARVDLVSPRHFHLHRGVLTATAGDAALDFTVTTPVARMTHLYGSFGVRVDDAGITETQVFSGSVDVCPPDDRPGERKRLVQNHGVRIDDAFGLVAIPVDRRGFPQPTRSYVCLADTDFSLGTKIGLNGIPPAEHQWSGDPAVVVAAEQGITPHSGEGMLKFLSTNSPGYAWDLSTAASQQWQIVDLRGYRAEIDRGGVSADASVYFNRVAGDASTDVRLALHAFRGEPNQARRAWGRREVHRLGRAEAEIPTDDDTLTWERADVHLPVPRGTGYLIVEIRAVENVRNDIALPEFDGHYADDVSLTLHVKPACSRVSPGPPE